MGEGRACVGVCLCGVGGDGLAVLKRSVPHMDAGSGICQHSTQYLKEAGAVVQVGRIHVLIFFYYLWLVECGIVGWVGCRG